MKPIFKKDYIAFSVSTNKTLEAQFMSHDKARTWASFSINWSCKTDHAGFSFDIGFLKWYFDFNISDNRHWNYEQDRWYLPKEEQTWVYTKNKGDVKIPESKLEEMRNGL